jgi:hypothetical protein
MVILPHKNPGLLITENVNLCGFLIILSKSVQKDVPFSYRIHWAVTDY